MPLEQSTPLQQLSTSIPNRKPKNQIVLTPQIRRYIRAIPCLLIALCFYSALYYLMHAVYPNQVQDWLFPNSYLPFMTLLLFGNFFLFTFVTLSARYGLLLALTSNWLIYIRLLTISFDLYAWGSGLVLMMILYFLTNQSIMTTRNGKA